MPRARRLMAATAVVLMAAGVAAPVAAIGQEAGPGELWRVYPLDPQTSEPQTPVAPKAADSSAVSTESDDDGLLPLILGLAATTVALVAIESFLAVRRARRKRAAAYPLTPSPTAPTRGAHYGAPELARLAADYIEIVSSGSRRPVIDLAARRSWDVERTRRALGRARARGLLVSQGRGRVGGTLSDEARRLLGGSTAAVAQPHDEPQPGPGFVDRAHRVVDEPGGEADLADDVLGDAGRHAEGSFRPRHPRATVGQNGRASRR